MRMAHTWYTRAWTHSTPILVVGGPQAHELGILMWGLGDRELAQQALGSRSNNPYCPEETNYECENTQAKEHSHDHRTGRCL